MQPKGLKKLIAVILTTTGLTASTSLFAIANQNQPKINSQADMGLETLEIYNVAISVPDIDESVRWYSDKLSFKLQSRRQVSTGIEIALMEKNGFFIDLIKIPNQRNLEGKPKNPPAHLEVIGIRNMVFYVNDLKAANAQLKAKGVPLIWESRYIPEIGTSITNFRDNNGNLIAIWERQK